MTESTEPADVIVDRKRSPAYPTLDVGEAIEKVRILYDEDKGSSATSEVIAGHWKSKTTSSAFMQWIASLKRYGLLVQISATGGGKQWKVSPQAVDVLLLPDDDPKRLETIKRVALTPTIHRDLWKEYGINLPSDANLRHKLVTTQGFKPNAATELIDQFKRTLLFAKLTSGDRIGEEILEDKPKVGDFIQWESQGALQFAEPKRVVAISDDGGFLRVEGSMTGIPIDQTHVEQPPAAAGKVRQPQAPSGPSAPSGASGPIFSRFVAPKIIEDTYTAASGKVAVCWPASLSEDEYQDIEGWLEMIKKKIKRSVNSDDPDSPYGPAKIEMDPR